MFFLNDIFSVFAQITMSQKHTIRIHHECEGRIEKSVPRDHRLSSLSMTNDDPEGQIFLSYPHTTNGFFFLLTIKYCIFMSKKGSQKSPNMLRCNMI